MKYLFKNARILKMNGEKIILSDLIVKDNKIAYIGNVDETSDSFDRIIQCDGNVLMPGFKNCHTHSGMVFLRSYMDDMPLQEWLFDYCIPIEEKLTEEDIYHLTKVSVLEYLSSGITICCDQYYFPHIFKKVCLEMGMRSLICLSPTTYYSKEKLEELYEENDNNSLVNYCFSLHAEYTASEDDVNLINELVHKYHAPFYAHVAETKREVKECVEKRKMGPVEYFYQKGLFNYGGGGFHAIYLNDNEVKIFKDSHLNIISNPGSNTKLASGILPYEKMRKENINICLGTDGPSSNNCLDMFKEMMLVSSLSKIDTMDASATPAIEILKMATINGSKALGLKDIDTLEVNKRADIIMIDLHRPNMQPIINVEKNIVFSGSKENIKMTMIDGHILYEDGKFFVNEDVEQIYRNAQKVTERLLNK